MKHIVYKYADVATEDEMAFDAHDLFTITKGDCISKHGIAWRIESVERQGGQDPKQIPTWWVYLTRVVMN